MRRVLAIYVPFLSTQRWSSERDAATALRAQTPIAAVTPHGSTVRLVSVNPAAQGSGLRGGMTLADAKALAPSLVTFEDDPVSDHRRLEALAIWAGGLSPVVHIEDADTVALDVTGCERLFRGEDNLLRQAVAGVEAQGFTARGAIADTLGGAWALSHAHWEVMMISPPGRVIEDLAPLPVHALRIDRTAVASLSSLGVETVASLLHLPRSSLASRFGQDVLDRIDQATGDMPEMLTPFRPDPVVTEYCHFGGPTDRRDVLHEGLRCALAAFCRRLEKRVAGVRQLFVTFHCPDVIIEDGTEARKVTIPVHLSQATRSSKHLYSLLIAAREGSALPAPVQSLVVWARAVEPLDGFQEELFTTDADDARELGDLLDRLAARLGAQAVVRAQPLSDHQPERAYRYVSVAGERGTGNGDRGTGGLRPLRLSPKPIEVAATAVVPEGPPVFFRWRDQSHAVVHSAGPERIETGWWRGPHVQRDYYRVLTDGGRRCWLFRDRPTGHWFLHGWFD